MGHKAVGFVQGVRECCWFRALAGLPDGNLSTFRPALYRDGKNNGWTVISMEDDWKQISVFEQNCSCEYKEKQMRLVLGAIAVSTLLDVGAATAQVQGVDLNGRYRCVAQCLGPRGGVAVITQNGWELNAVNDAGQPSRGWVDYPGRIWIQQANQGAIYSPDGLRIQFDGGAIWQRARAARRR